LSGVLQGVCWSDELGIFVVVGYNSVYTSTLKGRPPTMFNTFDSEFNSIDEDGTWNFNSLTLPIVGDVEDAKQGKQDTIEDGDLTIEKTSGLQTALDNKYDDTGGTIDGDVDITGNLVVGTTNIITEIGTKQNTIEDGDLTIANTAGLQTALDDKQEIINEDTNLSCKRVYANQLVAFQSQLFDTIVIRRPTGQSGRNRDFIINLQELQCWVNDVNILASNAADLVSLYALWTDKGVDIGAESPSTGAYNNEFTFSTGSFVFYYDTHSSISYKFNE